MSVIDFSEVFKQISVLTADGEVSEYEKVSMGEEEVKAKIEIIKTHGEEIKLRFLPYDDNYYAVEKNGAVEFITGKKAVELMLYAVSCVK